MPKTAPSPNPNPALELALLGLLALLWGASYPLIKVAVGSIPPVTLVAVRVTIAAILLWAFALASGNRVPTAAGLWGMFLLQACLNSILPFTMITWGQQFIDSGLAGILNSTSPVFVFFITLLWTRHETTDMWKLLGAVVGLGGVVLIIGTDALAGLGQQVSGQIAIVLATVCYACAAIYGRQFKDVPPAVTAAGTMTWAGIVLLPVSFLLEEPASVTPSRESLVALALLAVFSTAGALILYFRLVNSLGSMGTASVAYLRAGVSVVLGAVFLDEAITWTVAAGLTAVVFAVAAINGQIRLYRLTRIR